MWGPFGKSSEKWASYHKQINDYELKIPYMQTFRFIKVTMYHEGNKENFFIFIL
jgi:hypothetical protein